MFTSFLVASKYSLANPLLGRNQMFMSKKQLLATRYSLANPVLGRNQMFMSYRQLLAIKYAWVYFYEIKNKLRWSEVYGLIDSPFANLTSDSNTYQKQHSIGRSSNRLEGKHLSTFS